ncbi:hypothetical protein GCM10009681_35310 [Luedemannella helvata]|uniref:Uncharacterized protein n=1 Tax=Luedemannella helvata TaxID=349315 RepID=A0ABN2KNI3_9ACTN
MKAALRGGRPTPPGAKEARRSVDRRANAPRTTVTMGSAWCADNRADLVFLLPWLNWIKAWFKRAPGKGQAPRAW